jgi:predicted TIM-barrel fold metal-dependent hydrolase
MGFKLVREHRKRRRVGMSTTTKTQRGATAQVPLEEVIISADSHIMEKHDLWATRVPERFRDLVPKFPSRDESDNKPGGYDPKARLQEMAVDKVSAEVLYPTLGLRLFGIEDPEAQEACFRVGNDHLIDYCSVAPDKLLGIPMISAYSIPNAIKEMERCRAGGLRGALIWQVPPERLRFTTQHYEEFWAAAQDMDVPVNLHILTGFNYTRTPGAFSPMEQHRNSVNVKTYEAMNALFDLIFYGVLERFPRLKVVFVENEIGWMPFVIHQWDRYVQRFGSKRPLPITELPSFYVNRQVYATFFNDPPGGHLLSFWGEDNCMWSSDYPHGNSTWPHSREVIARDLGHLSPEARRKVVRDNVVRLYNLDLKKVAAP